MGFMTPVFPEAFKKAIVQPIFNTGAPYELENYRGISLLPWYPNRFSMKNGVQYGIVKKRNIDQPVLKTFLKVFKALNSVEISTIALLDWST